MNQRLARWVKTICGPKEFSSIPFLVQSVGFFGTSLLVFTSFSASLRVFTAWELVWIYFLILSGLAWNRQRQFVVMEWKDFSWQESRFLFLGLLVTICVYSYCIGQLLPELYIWLDENTQINQVLWLPDRSLLQGAAADSQPPLTYPIFGEVVRALGLFPLTLKAPSILFGLLSVVAFFLFCLRVSGSLLFTIAFSLVFTSFPTVVFHSVEARPIIFFIFYLLITLFFLWECVNDSKRDNLVSLGIYTFLMMLSVGLQPPIVVMWAILVLSMAILSKQISFFSAKRSILALGAGALAALPVLSASIFRSQGLGKFHNSVWDGLHEALSIRLPETLPNLLSPLLRILPNLSVIWLALGIALLVITGRGLVERMRPLLLVLSVGFYLFLFNVIFRAAIHYQLMARYLEAFNILIFCGLVFFFRYIILFPRPWVRVPLGLCAAIAFAPGLMNLGEYRSFYDDTKNYDVKWPKIYDFLNATSANEHDCFFMLPLARMDRWAQTFFVAPTVKMDRKHIKKFPDPNWHSYLGVFSAGEAAAIASKKKCDDIYWIVSGDKFLEEKRFDTFKVEEIDVFDHRDPVIFRIRANGKSLYERYVFIGDAILENLGGDERTSHLRIDLSLAAIAAKDDDRVLEFYEPLEKAPTARGWIEDPQNYNYFEVLNEIRAKRRVN